MSRTVNTLGYSPCEEHLSVFNLSYSHGFRRFSPLFLVSTLDTQRLEVPFLLKMVNKVDKMMQNGKNPPHSGYSTLTTQEEKPRLNPP